MPVIIDPEKDLVLSYSSLQSLQGCARKFALTKITPVDAPREESAAMSMGKAVGAGYAAGLNMLRIGDITEAEKAAVFATWLAYTPRLEDNVRSLTKAHVVVAALLDTPIKPYKRETITDWRLAVFDGKPAIELSFCIRLAPSIVYVGYLDAVMYSPSTGMYRPLELKTTALTSNLEVTYHNSSQALGYGMILQAELGYPQEDLIIHYRVAQMHRAKAEAFHPTIHDFYFNKSIVAQLEWLIGLQQVVQVLEMYKQHDMYPMNGGNCLSWNRPCKYYGVCGLDVAGMPAPATTAQPREYQWAFHVDSLIEDLIREV